MLNKKKVSVIGSGFAGIAGAASLAQKGVQVEVYEKNEHFGGRARQFDVNGFKFDMGPSWYWMPDVFDKFFEKFGKHYSEYYELKKLDPGFQMIFNETEIIHIPENFEELCELFESIETGAADQLKKFMDEAEYKYKVGVNDLVYQPGLSLTELMRVDLMMGVFKLQVFTSFSKHVRKFFKDPRLISLMEFPVLFLGAMPKDTPALYSLMNYAGLKMGTYYPMGGFAKVIDAMKSIAEEQGVVFKNSAEVKDLKFDQNLASGLKGESFSSEAHAILAGADYHHVDQHILKNGHRNYTEAYWDKKVFAPSCLLFYLGVDKKLNKLEHHNLFFDEDLNPHAIEIYKTKQWPKKPLFYVCCPSKTDPSVAPEGKENVFILMPIAPGIHDEEEIREEYFEKLIKRLESFCGENIVDHIEYKRSYCVKDFEKDYHAYKGNAYGLANTLNQTANLKPSMRSKHIKNLFYTGQLTVPGPGVPPSIISGQVAAEQIIKYLNQS